MLPSACAGPASRDGCIYEVEIGAEFCHRDVATAGGREASWSLVSNSPCRARVGYPNRPANEEHQPTQGTHPEGTGVSPLDYILDGHQTIPSDRGLFLAETWRLHPAICAFTSEVFYESRLVPFRDWNCRK
jgi:hypothetical protein